MKDLHRRNRIFKFLLFLIATTALVAVTGCGGGGSSSGAGGAVADPSKDVSSTCISVKDVVVDPGPLATHEATFTNTCDFMVNVAEVFLGGILRSMPLEPGMSVTFTALGTPAFIACRHPSVPIEIPGYIFGTTECSAVPGDQVAS